MPTEVKPVIDRLWDRLWAGGIANPLVAIEQVAYLLLLKMLEDRSPRPAQWSALSRLDDEPLMQWLHLELIPTLRTVSGNSEFDLAMADAGFAIPKPSLVRECIEALDAV